MNLFLKQEPPALETGTHYGFIPEIDMVLWQLGKGSYTPYLDDWNNEF